MNNNRYRWILYIISIVIVATVIIQIYWNYKNYQVNKQQLINDVQQCLDDAVQDYYADLAQNETLSLIIDSDDTTHTKQWKNDSLLLEFDFLSSNYQSADSTLLLIDKNTNRINLNTKDSLRLSRFKFRGSTSESRYIQRFDSLDIDSASNVLGSLKFLDPLKYHNSDSISLERLKSLTSMVIISVASDGLKVASIDSLFSKQLEKKKIDLDYKLKSFDVPESHEEREEVSISVDEDLMVTSQSPFLRNSIQLNAYFNNPTRVILKRILSGILLSLLLVLAVIFCIFYLLKVINKQKHLSELKNDLISNITHEFKTPIATIGVAIESIKDFETMNDQERTNKYLNMSQSQLSKLNNMVEKLLETASLDSEDLQLNKDKIDLVDLLQQIIAKQEMLKGSKKIKFNTAFKNYDINLDVFHVENAITNVIDNAIKYGGEIIDIDISKKSNGIKLRISDNGNSLNQSHKNKIFEKFYRVPKGNTHDVKGFGIGLFYTKTIIEKHQGTIELSLKNNRTSFIIELPND